MRELIGRVCARWNSYKYRFVPWIALNINDRTAVQLDKRDIIPPARLVDSLHSTLSELKDYASLCEDLSVYDALHSANQLVLLHTHGFCVGRGASTLQGAGTGVFVLQGTAKKGCIVGLYPGTVYQPYQPILIQSISNRFIFRCVDGVLLDGKDRTLSRTIFRSCAGRDQVGLLRCCDSSWLTPRPVNPLNVGQYVNNGSASCPANVYYQEVDLPPPFPLRLRKFIPNVNFSSVCEDGERALRLVTLVALRDIEAGEELFSSYFTVIKQ